MGLFSSDCMDQIQHLARLARAGNLPAILLCCGETKWKRLFFRFSVQLTFVKDGLQNSMSTWEGRWEWIAKSSWAHVLTLNSICLCTALAGSKLKLHRWRWLVWAGGTFLAFSSWFTGKVSAIQNYFHFRLFFLFWRNPRHFGSSFWEIAVMAWYLKLISK